jgi:hypothetical protein
MKLLSKDAIQPKLQLQPDDYLLPNENVMLIPEQL